MVGKYYKSINGSILKCVKNCDLYNVGNWALFEIIVNKNYHSVSGDKLPPFCSYKGDPNKRYTWGGDVVICDLLPHWLEVTDTRLARKMYPKFEKLENGNLRILE